MLFQMQWSSRNRFSQIASWVTDTEAAVVDLMDPVINQASNCLNQFDRSNGFLIYLNQALIKERGSNLSLRGQDGLKMSTIFEIKYAEIEVSIHLFEGMIKMNWLNRKLDN